MKADFRACAKHGPLKVIIFFKELSMKKYSCPKCKEIAFVSQYDAGNRARVYCASCSTYDVTRSAYKILNNKLLGERVKVNTFAPMGKIVILKQEISVTEDFFSLADSPPPGWFQFKSSGI